MSELPHEAEFRFRLRDQIVQIVRARDLSDRHFAETVGMTESGARHLLHRKDWSLERSLAVADALGVDVGPSVKDVAEA